MASLSTLFVILVTSRWQMEIFVAVVVLQCLVAIWVPLGRGKWPLRATIALLFIAALVYIRAYLPAVMLCISGVITTAVLSLVRWRMKSFPTQPTNDQFTWPTLVASIVFAAVATTYFVATAQNVLMCTGWHEPLFIIVGLGSLTTISFLAMTRSLSKSVRPIEHSVAPDNRHSVYTLKDLMIAATLGAVLFALVAISLRRPEAVNWTAFLGFATCLGTVNCLCCGVVLSATWRWRIAAAIALIVSMAVATPLLENAAGDWLAVFFSFRPTATVAKVFHFALTLGIVTLLCGVFLLKTANLIGWSQLAVSKTKSVMPNSLSWKNRILHLPTLAKIACLIITTTLAGILTPLYVHSSGALPSPPESTTNAETYHQLTAQLAAVSASNRGGSTTHALRGYGKQAAADDIDKRYQAIEDLIDSDVSTHVNLADLAPTAIEETSEMSELQNMRALARSWAAEIQLSRASNDIEASMSRTCDLLRFGSRIAIGGVMMHELVGIACETLAQPELLTDLPKLNEDQLGRVLDTLHDVDLKREPRELILMRDHRYMDRRKTWQFRMNEVNKLYARDPSSPPSNEWFPAAEACDEASRRRDAVCRMLIIHAALTLHHRQNEIYPETLRQLSPGILATIPIDPYSNDVFLYKRQGMSFVLYSQRSQPHGIMLPRDEHTTKYLWNVQETIDGQRVLPPSKSTPPSKQGA